jgi:hypothetical protein
MISLCDVVMVRSSGFAGYAARLSCMSPKSFDSMFVDNLQTNGPKRQLPSPVARIGVYRGFTLSRHFLILPISTRRPPVSHELLTPHFPLESSCARALSLLLQPNKSAGSESRLIHLFPRNCQSPSLPRVSPLLAPLTLLSYSSLFLATQPILSHRPTDTTTHPTLHPNLKSLFISARPRFIHSHVWTSCFYTGPTTRKSSTCVSSSSHLFSLLWRGRRRAGDEQE